MRSAEMKTVWFVQDYNSMRVDEVFTTKKAAFEKAKDAYGKGGFKEVTKGWVYWYCTKSNDYEPACSVEKVPVRKVKRK